MYFCCLLMDALKFQQTEKKKTLCHTFFCCFNLQHRRVNAATTLENRYQMCWPLERLHNKRSKRVILKINSKNNIKTARTKEEKTLFLPPGKKTAAMNTRPQIAVDLHEKGINYRYNLSWVTQTVNWKEKINRDLLLIFIFNVRTLTSFLWNFRPKFSFYSIICY